MTNKERNDLDLRARALNSVEQRENSFIQSWLDKTEFSDPAAYKFEYGKHTVTLYTNHTGFLVGSKGCNIETLKTMLHDEFSGTWEIKIVDVAGFANCKTERSK